MDRKIAGLLLAGGRNSRMGGRKKAFLTWEGKCFYEREREALGRLFPVWLSVEEREPYEGTRMPLLEDQYKGTGPMGAICTAMETLDVDALMVLPCDVPGITKETILQLAACYERTGSLVLLSGDGRLQPLIGIYPCRYVKRLQDMLSKGNYRMMDFLSGIPFEVYEGKEGECENINTPKDYKRLTGKELQRGAGDTGGGAFAHQKRSERERADGGDPLPSLGRADSGGGYPCSI